MHFKCEAMDAVIAREFRRFLPVRNDLLLPLPLQHLVVLFWPMVSHPVGLRVCRRPSRATGESHDDLHINPLGQLNRLSKGVGIFRGWLRVRMDGIAVAT